MKSLISLFSEEQDFVNRYNSLHTAKELFEEQEMHWRNKGESDYCYALSLEYKSEATKCKTEMESLKKQIAQKRAEIKRCLEGEKNG